MSTTTDQPHVSPFGRAMDSLHVTAYTPNEQVFGGLSGWYDVRIGIAPGYAERVGDSEIAAQLTRLARILFAERTRAIVACSRSTCSRRRCR